MVLDDISESIGEGIGTVAAGLVAAIPPILKELIPALVESLKQGLSILGESIKENVVPITTWATFLVILYLAFIAVRFNLAPTPMRSIV